MVVLGDESLQRHCGGSLITVLRCVQRREIPSTPAALLKQLNSEGYLQAQEQQRRSVRDSYEVPASRQLCIEHLMHGVLPQLWDFAVPLLHVPCFTSAAHC